MNIVLSELAPCAGAGFCFPVGGKKLAKDTWIRNADLSISQDGRVFTKATDRNGRRYTMDAVTGTLYLDGGCMTSDRLMVRGLVKDTDRAVAVLMAMKVER
jgi:hypothetical protein